jgi:photosystem II stability/assembly factor-like uncharacterized protein
LAAYGALALCTVLAGLFVAAAGNPLRSPASAAAETVKPPPIRHVWVIALENSSWIDGSAHESPLNTPGRAPYLRDVLRKRGNTLTQYWGIAHNSQPNYIAMVSGQGANGPTQDDCGTGASEWSPPNAISDSHGQLVGQGCYFPATIKTLYNQLDDHNLSWKEYQEDYGNQPSLDGFGGPCPVPPNGGATSNLDRYAAKHDPAQWFHALVDNQAACRANDLPLYRLAKDLQSVKTTANFNFITPNLDNDGHQTDAGPFPKTADPWLRQYVPMIMNSPAYRQDGMVIITFDESDTTTGVPNNTDDTDANLQCCNEIPGPNSPSPGIFGTGGGRTGTVVLSPFVKPGSSTDIPYNHYSFLRSMEDLFGIDAGGDDGHGHLGFAGSYGPDYPGPGAFGADVYNASRPPGPGSGGPSLGGAIGPRKTDGSTTWQHPLPHGNDLNGVSCPTPATCVAVGDDGSIAKTVNGGDSWSVEHSGVLAKLNGVSCATVSACVVVGDSGLILTTGDSGATWSQRPSGSDVDLSGVACPTAGTCYAVGGEGTIAKSIDGGATWATQNSGVQDALNDVSCTSTTVCYAVGNAARIVATKDGATWATQTTSVTDRISGVSCSTSSSCIAVADGNYIRTTNGTSWTTGSGPVAAILTKVSCPTASTCFSVGLYHPSSNGSSFEPGTGFIAGTTNGGGSFVAGHVGLASALRDISCPQSDSCTAVGARGTIVKTADAGAHWPIKSVGSDSELARMVCSNRLQCLAEGMNAVQAASCPDSSNCFAVGSYGTTMVTHDGGSTWADQIAGSPDNSGNADPPLPPPGLNGVACPGPTRCFAVGDVADNGQASIKATSDGGSSWQNQTSNSANDLLAVSCPAVTTCIAAGTSGGMVKTDDGGLTWHELDSGVGNTLSAISCPDTSTCVAVGNFGAVLRTTDGGAHWATENSGTTAYLAGVSCPSVNLCIAVGSGGTVLRIPGGGQPTQESSGVGDDLMSVSCASHTHCLATGSLGTVISTATGGNDWDVQGSGTSRALRAASCPSTDRCIAAGDAAAILGVTPTAKPGNGPPPEGGGPGPGGLGDLLNGVSCEARALKSEILGRGLRVTRRLVHVSGRSRTHQCRQDRVTRVRVAIARTLRRGRCQFLGANGRLGRARLCSRPVYQFARVRYVSSRLVTDWSFSRRVVLPPGRYRIQVRGQDRIGLLEPGVVSRPALVSARSR